MVGAMKLFHSLLEIEFQALNNCANHIDVVALLHHLHNNCFLSMLGLQVSPKLTREASAFWKKIREVKSVGERDQIWSGLLPTADDLLDPEKFPDKYIYSR